MGGFIKRDVERVKTTGLNQQVNTEVLNNFRDACKKAGYPLNIMLETFMLQYTNGRFYLSDEDIMKFKVDKNKEEDGDKQETSMLNTTINKEIHVNFRNTCRANGYFVKHVLTAFMEKYTTENLVMEYVNADEIN